MPTAKREGRYGRFDRDSFERAFLSADYPECHRLLKGDTDSERAVLLQARVAWREQRYVDMIGPLSRLTSNRREVGLERDILLGAAFGSTKDYATARLRLERVLEAVPTGQLRSDALFYKALVAWMEQDHRESEAIASELSQSDSPNDRARAHVLLSWIAIRRRDVQRHIDELVAALDTVEDLENPDEYYRAKALMTLALLCRELPLPDLTARVHKTFGAMRWEAGTRLPHFQITRFFGWINALQGDELAAFRSFREAMSLAPSDHWRVLCLTDRAYLARNTGEQSFAVDMLNEAHELAQSLEWQTTADEERSALIVLAELFAGLEPAKAQQYLAQFRSLSSSVLPGLSYGTDPRVRAFAEYSSGIALLELGDRDHAITMLSDASEIFNAFGYGWRSALCAIGLYKATDNASWLIEARRQITAWPNSWIAREVAQTSDASEDSRVLSNAQRAVLEFLLEGKSNAGIAKALGRSPYTVRNHIAQLFKQYNVTNRTQLAAIFRQPAVSPQRKRP